METEPTFTFAELQAQDKVTAAGQLSVGAFTDDLTLTRIVLPFGVTSIAEGGWNGSAFFTLQRVGGMAVPSTDAATSSRLCRGWVEWQCLLHKGNVVICCHL
jgi:hypothetical protein